MAEHLILRTLTAKDHPDALELYVQLAGGALVGQSANTFDAVLNHPGTSVLGAESAGRIRSMLTLHILPNVTQNGRAYALVENVVTHTSYRGRGLGRRTMEYAIATAWEADCYKIMLLTGRQTTAKAFYEKLGFSADQKWGMQLRRVPPRTPT